MMTQQVAPPRLRQRRSNTLQPAQFRVETPSDSHGVRACPWSAPSATSATRPLKWLCLHIAARWLASWGVVLAVSVLLALGADALLVPPASDKVVAVDLAEPTHTEMLLALGQIGTIAHVNCSADGDTGEVDV